MRVGNYPRTHLQHLREGRAVQEQPAATAVRGGVAGQKRHERGMEAAVAAGLLHASQRVQQPAQEQQLQIRLPHLRQHCAEVRQHLCEQIDKAYMQQ